MEKLISENKIILPGGNKQFEHFRSIINLPGENALIIGPGCEEIANQMLSYYNSITIIVNDYDSLLHSRSILKDEEKIKVKMMDYSHTDFRDEWFDIIYAQGSLSIPDKKNIVKELKRILKMNGVLCSGEIVSIKEPVPSFVKDIWDLSGLEPLSSSEISSYFQSRGFELVSEQDLSNTLKDFYEKISFQISKASKEEKEQNKKLFTRMKHESNVYLKLGGDKFIGFKSLIMRKVN